MLEKKRTHIECIFTHCFVCCFFFAWQLQRGEYSCENNNEYSHGNETQKHLFGLPHFFFVYSVHFSRQKNGAGGGRGGENDKDGENI